MNPFIQFLPLILALALALGVLLAPTIDWIGHIFSSISRGLFTHGFTKYNSPKARQRRQLLQAAQNPSTYRAYNAKTTLQATLYGIVGALLGVYLIIPLLNFFGTTPATILSFITGGLIAQPPTSAGLTPRGFLFSLALSTLTVGVVVGALHYQLRWWLLKNRASVRGKHIEKTLPAVVAFLYAMSRRGISFSEILRVLADNKSAYGATAEDVEIAVRDMDLYGEDLNTALRRMADRTPSQQFEEFTQNLLSVMQSNRSISPFLREQYERYQETLESQQRQLLDAIATLAEIYVSVLVVGSLLLVSILAILGMFGVGDTIPIVRALVYIIIPIANISFIIYLDSITDTGVREYAQQAHDGVVAASGAIRSADSPTVTTDRERSSLSVDETAARLSLYNSLKSIRLSLTSPKQTLIHTPEKIFYVTVPTTLIAIAIGVYSILPQLTTIFPLESGLSLFTWSETTVTIARQLDDFLILAAIWLCGTYAIAYHFHSARIKRFEKTIPDFLDRLANVNEAGMTIVQSLRRLDRGSTDVGPLNDEVKRTLRDIDWGADVSTALLNLEQRTQTASMTRVVTLITNAMKASGNIGPVLRIAADEAQNIRRIRLQRKREMFTYLIVVYMTFIVFLVIIIALTNVLLPAIPTDTGALQQAGFGVSDASPEEYTLTLYHIAAIQGFVSGLVAGQMGEESLKAGTKHATIMLSVTYILFAIIL